MGEIEKYIGRRLDGGNVIPVLSAGIHPDAVGAGFAATGFNLDSPRVHKFGSNPGIDSLSVPEDVWDGSDVYPGFIPAAATCEILSSDPADDGSPAGAGARTVEVQGLDLNFEFKTVTITMNGVGTVALGSFLRIFRAIVRTSGNPTNTNVGTITIRTVGTAITMAIIQIGRGQTLMAIYTVPANYQTSWLTQYSASLQAGNAQARSAELSLETRPFGGSWNTKEFIELHSYGGLAVHPYPLPVEIESRTDIRWRVLAVSSNATLVNATFDLLLVDP